MDVLLLNSYVGILYNPSVLNEHCSEWIVVIKGVYQIAVALYWSLSPHIEFAVRGADVLTTESTIHKCVENNNQNE